MAEATAKVSDLSGLLNALLCGTVANKENRCNLDQIEFVFNRDCCA